MPLELRLDRALHHKAVHISIFVSFFDKLYNPTCRRSHISRLTSIFHCIKFVEGLLHRLCHGWGKIEELKIEEIVIIMQTWIISIMFLPPRPTTAPMCSSATPIVTEIPRPSEAPGDDLEETRGDIMPWEIWLINIIGNAYSSVNQTCWCL